MTRRPIPIQRQRQAARQGAVRMISRAERPGYRLRMAQDGRWTVTEAPWLVVGAVHRRDVIQAARAVIAAWLGCDPLAFDVEVV